MAPHKYETVAGLVRDMIADGTLKPGAPAPSGAALARETGFCTLTSRKALRALLADGTLTWGASPNARLRVAADRHGACLRCCGAAAAGMLAWLSGLVASVGGGD